MSAHAPTYVLIHPDGRAEWGDRLLRAEEAMGAHGVDRAALTPGSRLRVAVPGCGLLLPEEYAANPYAATVLAHVAGAPPRAFPETRGPVALFGSDPANEWDGTRPLTGEERAVITEALAAAGCTTA